MKRYIGVDLHQDQITVCYLKQNGEKTLRQFKLELLNRFKQTLHPQDEIAVEAVGNSRFFCEEVVTLVEKVVLVSPGNFKVISSSYKKTDKADAETLARYLKDGRLPTARIMSKQQAYVKSIVNTRNKFVKQRTQCKNKIHNILSSLGIVPQRKNLFTAKGIANLQKMNFAPLVKLEIELLVKQILILNEAIEQIAGELQKPENQLPGHRNLTSIKGIGEVSAAIFTSAIGEVKDFPNEKKITSFFGMVPWVKESNLTKHYGHITKHGNRLVRATLVQCTLVVIKYNPYFRDFYNRIKQKKGSGVAIIATARKLLEFIYMTLNENIIWEDSCSGVIKSQG
jgi:transposase